MDKPSYDYTWYNVGLWFTMIYSLIGTMTIPFVMHYTMLKARNPQRFISVILFVLWLVCLCNFFESFIVIIVEKVDYDSVKYISALAFTAWLAIIWALSFKYW